MATTILVPIDGSPLSFDALRHALETYPDATITAYHITNVYDTFHRSDDHPSFEPMMGSEEWYEMERQVADELFDEAQSIAAEYDREVETESDIGDPERLIPEYAEEEAVDHIVMGAHGRESPDRSLFGRVVQTVVVRASVPVTVIR